MQIPYQKYTLTIEAVNALYLPYYKGSTFKGGFGSMFRRIICALKRQDCLDCMLKSRCIYAYVFETPPPEGASIMNMHKYEKIPHSFIIEPPEAKSGGAGAKESEIIAPETLIKFNLILIGKAIDYLPYFVYTFDELGKIGIGKGRGKYRLKEVRLYNNGTLVYSENDRSISKNVEPALIEILDFIPSDKIDDITLRFITPLRMKYNRDLVVIPEFHILIRHLLRRLGLLYYFHCGNNESSWNHREIISHAQTIKIVSSSLRWFDWQRYSSRQNTKMKLGGLVGEITYRGNLKPYITILRAGEILHAGKNTSFGLGKYEIK